MTEVPPVTPDPPRRQARRPARRQRQDNRRQQLLDAAARLFSERGFAGTTMRDVAGEVGMLAGSVYYHFPSKEELLVAVQTEGIRRIDTAVRTAIADVREPWARLETACAAHLRAVLNSGSYPRVVVRELPHVSEELRARLAALRNSYETVFRELVEDLPLPAGSDRTYLRLALLGALNWSRNWYSAEGDPPETIAHHFVSLLRRRLDEESG